MSDERFDEFYSRLDEAMSMPTGDPQYRLAEELLREADAIDDFEVKFDARLLYVNAACFAGRSAKILPAFAWCLAQVQAGEEIGFRRRYFLLWQFKYVLSVAEDNHFISLDQFEKLLSQMDALYRESGYSRRPVHYKNLNHAVGCGDIARATSAFEKFVAEPRDAMADCEACEPDNLMRYFELIGDLERAVETAAPILRGEFSCGEVPQRTYSKLLLPLSKLGRYEEADHYHELGYSQIESNSNYLTPVARHIAYLTHRNRLDEAAKLFEKYLTWSLQSFVPTSQHLFWVVAEHLFERLSESHSRYSFDLPPEFRGFRDDGNYVIAELLNVISDERQKLAEKFDARNGSNYFSTKLRDDMRY